MGEPLVLLPAAMCDLRLYWQLMVRFSHRCAVQFVPLIGADSVEQLAEEVLAAAPRQFALAGHGLGGAVALEVLRRASGRVLRIALMATDPLPETPQSSAVRELRIVGARAGRLSQVLAEDVPDSALAPGIGRLDVRRLLVDMGKALGPDVYARQVRAIQRRPDQQKTLRRMLTPALVLCGAHDAVVPARRQEFMSQLIPRSRFTLIETAGHMLPMEQPGPMCRALEEWMAAPSVLN